MELCIIIDIKICGLINVDECFVCAHWNLVIPINPLGVRHPIEQCGMLTPSFLHLFRCIYRSWWSTGGAGRTLRYSRRFWSGLVEKGVFVVFVVLEFALVNCELWICNEILFWLNCLNINFYFWTVMIIIISCCFWVVIGILLVGGNSSVMYV